MTKEDYVSFETAKLLKEKGFNGLCNAYYDCFTTDNFHSSCEPTDFNSIDTKIRDIVSAPTLQMAMKWLREVHNVFISVNIGNHKKDAGDTSMPDFVYYFFYITDTKAVYEEEKQCYKEFSTFEEACEEAIQYCLEHLLPKSN